MFTCHLNSLRIQTVIFSYLVLELCSIKCFPKNCVTSWVRSCDEFAFKICIFVLPQEQRPNLHPKMTSTYKSNQSVYSHGRYVHWKRSKTNNINHSNDFVRSSTNLASQKSRSMKSVTVPWYQKPILKNNKYINVQKSSMFAALFSIVSELKIRLFPLLIVKMIICYSACRFLLLVQLPSTYTV